MEPNNLQDLQELIVSPDYPEQEEDRTWSFPVQIFVDEFESSDPLSAGNFSIVVPEEEESAPASKRLKVSKNKKSRGTSTSHICNACSSEFQDATMFIRHLKSHSDERPYSCDICPKSYKYPWLLKKHKAMVHSEVHGTNSVVHTCETCFKTFPCQSALKVHMNHHQGVKAHACTHEGCNKTYTWPSQLSEHIKSHSADPWTCKTCPKTFQSRSGWSYHTKRCLGSKLVKCPKCDREFGTRFGFTVHQREPCEFKIPHTDNGMYVCSICRKFSSLKRDKVETHVCTVHKVAEAVDVFIDNSVT
eukprot:sb/3467270/